MAGWEWGRAQIRQLVQQQLGQEVKGSAAGEGLAKLEKGTDQRNKKGKMVRTWSLNTDGPEKEGRHLDVFVCLVLGIELTTPWFLGRYCAPEIYPWPRHLDLWLWLQSLYCGRRQSLYYRTADPVIPLTEEGRFGGERNLA